MKTYIKTTLTILISGMLFSSCEDQLNQANPNQATEDTFWKDETDFNLALTSCYTPLKKQMEKKLPTLTLPSCLLPPRPTLTNGKLIPLTSLDSAVPIRHTG